MYSLGAYDPDQSDETVQARRHRCCRAALPFPIPLSRPLFLPSLPSCRRPAFLCGCCAGRRRVPRPPAPVSLCPAPPRPSSPHFRPTATAGLQGRGAVPQRGGLPRPQPRNCGLRVQGRRARGAGAARSSHGGRPRLLRLPPRGADAARMVSQASRCRTLLPLLAKAGAPASRRLPAAGLALAGRFLLTRAGLPHSPRCSSQPLSEL